MAATQAQTNALLEKLKGMGKEKTLEYIKQNASTLKSDMTLAKAVASFVATAFTGIKTPSNSLISTGNKTNVPPVVVPPVTDTPVVVPPKTTSSYTGSSLTDFLSSSGQASSFADRAKIAAANGITNYTGTAAQNTQLLNTLRNSGTSSSSTTTPTPSTADTWGVVAKVNDPTRAANFINTLPGYQVKVNADGTVSGTKQGMPTTWKYDGQNWIATPDNQGFDHSGLAGASFVPDKTTADGISYNSKGTDSQTRYGIIKAQEDYLVKMQKEWTKQGLSVVQQKAEATKLIKELQDYNKGKDTYGKIPIQMTDTVGSMVDLNEDGIPDSQQGYGLDETKQENPPEVTTLTDNLTGDTYTSSNNFSDLEKEVIRYTQNMLKVEADAKEAARIAAEKVTDDNAKRIMAENDSYITNINSLLEEKIKANEQQYTDAIGAVARQLGGQVKQFQKIMGADGKPIDDATMLSLMGGVGVDAMSKIVDLKNELVTEYITQKDSAIAKISKLKMDNAIEANQADAAIAALNEKAKSDVITLTKEFYNKMFGMQEADQTRTATNLANSRAAVTSYLSALGQTPAQINQMINNYVVSGFTPEEAMQKLADDIRNGSNAVLNNIVKNNSDAAAAAQAKFEQDMALKIQPIIAGGDVDLQLQNDKQAWQSAENDADRQLQVILKRSTGSGGASASKNLSQSEWGRIYAAVGNNAGIPTSLTELQARDIMSSFSVIANTNNSDTARNEARAKLLSNGVSFAEDPNGTKAQTIVNGFKAPAQ